MYFCANQTSIWCFRFQEPIVSMNNGAGPDWPSKSVIHAGRAFDANAEISTEMRHKCGSLDALLEFGPVIHYCALMLTLHIRTNEQHTARP